MRLLSVGQRQTGQGSIMGFKILTANGRKRENFVIDIRPLNPARSGVDNPIGTFSDFEWRELIELAKEYGFEPPDIENYYPPQYDDPVEVNPDSSWELWHAISAAHHDEAVPPSVPAALGRLRVEELMGCAQIGAEQGGIEIRRSRGAG